MYESKLVVAVMANGKVLREHQDAVYLPFGCEYSLRVKNLNSVKALVRISIDGQDATEGTTGLIVPPNGSVDLERFIKGGNLSAGNRFKFIERTAAIEDGPRGIKVEDGLIRVEFEFEKPRPIVNDVYTNHHHVWGGWYPEYPPQPRWIKSPQMRTFSGDVTCSAEAGGGATIQNAVLGGMAKSAIARGESLSDAARGVTYDSASATAQNLAGITVPGSVSEQKFETGSWFPTDGQKHAMVLRLFGEMAGAPVVAPVTVKTKPVCSTCGHHNKWDSKFCSECGTGLVLA